MIIMSILIIFLWLYFRLVLSPVYSCSHNRCAPPWLAISRAEEQNDEPTIGFIQVRVYPQNALFFRLANITSYWVDILYAGNEMEYAADKRFMSHLNTPSKASRLLVAI